jgi:hypothetical protein
LPGLGKEGFNHKKAKEQCDDKPAAHRGRRRQFEDAQASSYCFQENDQLKSSDFCIEAVLGRAPHAWGAGQVLFDAPLGRGSWSGLASALLSFWLRCSVQV